jgi:hypothetical protein
MRRPKAVLVEKVHSQHFGYVDLDSFYLEIQGPKTSFYRTQTKRFHLFIAYSRTAYKYN